MEFQGFPKIARLNREVVVTEKIDGTNAQVYIVPADGSTESEIARFRVAMVAHDGQLYDIFAGSRNRYVTPGNDNFGFAQWVMMNAPELMKLGPGRHYGEWWGKGIQRGYGLDHKRFSLFNTSRWNEENKPSCCHLVPVMHAGPFDQGAIDACMWELRNFGSLAAEGFMNPEGVVVYHTAANSMFKVTLENDESPKSLVKEKVAATNIK